MSTTQYVLDQHLKSFSEKDLDALLADYSSDAVFFTQGSSLKGSDAIKPFSRLWFRSLASLAPRSRCGSNVSRVITLTSCGVQKLQTIGTRPLPTHSWYGTGKSWRNPLLPRLLRSAE